MPPRRAPPKKASPPKAPVPGVEKKKYCGGLKANSIDGELYWDDERAKSSSQYALRYLCKEEERTEEILAKLALDKKTRPVAARARSPSPETGGEGRGNNTTGYFPSAERSSGITLHKVMTSSQPGGMTFEEREEYYERTYPMNHLQLKELKETTSSVERVYFIQSLTGAGQSRTMEAVILSLRYLEDTERVEFFRCSFIDLMAMQGEALLYASAFGFPRLITLELSEESKREATRIIGCIPGLPDRSTILIGSVMDHFPCDCGVYYMDCTRVINSRKMGDEGLLVNLIFKLFKTLQPGAFLVLLTTMSDFSAARDFLAPHMRHLLKAAVHKGHEDECTLWIYGLDFHS